MDSMAIIEKQKIVQTTVTLARLSIIREQIILETMVRFSISRKN